MRRGPRLPMLTAAGAALISVAAVAAMVRLSAGPTASAEPSGRRGDPASMGARIWQTDCAMCHGTRGQGSFQGPDIRDAGTASVDFMVRTGRMPLPFIQDADLFDTHRSQDAKRGPVAYDEAEIKALVSHTAGFVRGPSVPEDPDLSKADLSRGGVLYRANCAACHQMAGSGGALAYGTTGPALGSATPVEILEAIRTGPGSMPVFPPSQLDESKAHDITAYVRYLQDPEDRGGLPLWHLGPVPEGLVAWIVGIGGAVLICLWLGRRESANTE